MEEKREHRIGAWLDDGDGHLWRVVRVASGTVTLADRAIEQVFQVAADGSVVSDREFSRVEVEVCDYGYVEGDCPVGDGAYRVKRR
ncbi:MAG: hypothetical protein H0V71_07245 [Chloroflexi bacterium]|nr:hypothetical protein [Chloroflexota bacterium]